MHFEVFLFDCWLSFFCAWGQWPHIFHSQVFIIASLAIQIQNLLKSNLKYSTVSAVVGFQCLWKLRSLKPLFLEMKEGSLRVETKRAELEIHTFADAETPFLSEWIIIFFVSPALISVSFSWHFSNRAFARIFSRHIRAHGTKKDFIYIVTVEKLFHRV